MEETTEQIRKAYYDRLDELMEKCCDNMCKYRDAGSQEELDEKCESCPLVEIATLLNV